MKTPETEDLEKRLMDNYFKPGSHIVFEADLAKAQHLTNVNNDMSNQVEYAGIVDAMQCDNYGTITCFELKVTKSDFHSKARLSFVGNKNYYVMPEALFDQVKNEIGPRIGVLVPLKGDFGLRCAKPARWQETEYDKTAILIAMLTASSNKTTIRNILKARPQYAEKPERKEKPKTPHFDKGKHKYARLEDGTIEPLYYKNGEARNFYKDEDGKWCMDFDRFFEFSGCRGQMLMHEEIVEFLEESEDAPNE